jgi:hypothetical protein
MADSGLLNSGNMVFDGLINTIGFSQCLFDTRPGTIAIVLPATAVVGRRFRTIYSSFVALAGETGIHVDPAATIPTEGFILDTINFSGGGLYLDGVTVTSNKALFVNCVGVPDSANIAQYTMNGNATPTTFTGTGVFTKVLGATAPGPYVAKFTLANNEATYVGARVGFFKVTAVAAVDAQTNREIAFRIAVNGSTLPSSETATNSEGTGRSAPATCQAIVSLSPSDVVEVWVANKTNTNNATVSALNTIIERLN